MKLTFPTPTSCRLQLQSWSGRLVGLAFIVGGFVVLALYFNSLTLICGKKTPGIAEQCILQEKIGFFYPLNQPIGQLLGTQIKTNNQKTNYSYQILLLTKALPSGIAYSGLTINSYSTAVEITKLIDNYIRKGTTNTIRLPQTLPLWILVVPLLFIPFGISIFLSSPKIQLDIDKNQHTVLLKRTSLLKCSSLKWDLTQLSYFFVDTQYANTSKSPFSSSPNLNGKLDNPAITSPTYGLALMLKGQGIIVLSPIYDSFYDHKAEIAQKLNQWAGLQEQRYS